MSALGDYEKQTNISLAEHPLAKQLESCQSVDSISSLLQDHARAFSELRGSDRILKSIKNIVSFLYKLSDTAALGDNIGLVCQETLMAVFYIFDIVLQTFPPAKAIHTGLGVLLVVCVFLKSRRAYHFDIQVHQTAKRVVGSYDALIDLLESMEYFLKRLDIYTRIPPTPVMDEIVVKIIVELISTLALATKELKQGRPSESVLADVAPYSVRRRETRQKALRRRKGC